MSTGQSHYLSGLRPQFPCLRADAFCRLPVVASSSVNANAGQSLGAGIVFDGALNGLGKIIHTVRGQNKLRG